MFALMEDVSFSYSVGTPFETKALDQVNLAIDKGESIGIVGRTGCGKSTLIQHLNGLLIPERGRVVVDGVDIRTKGTALKEVRKKVGLVFQYPEYQIFEETVFKEIAFGPVNLGVTEEELTRRVRWAMEVVGLDFDLLAGRSPFELSGGQMRRVAIASILSMKPEMLVLDEPTAGLDPEGKRLIFSRLVDLRKHEGLTLVIVSHSMEDLVTIAERIIVMDQGKIVLDGAIRDIFSQPGAITNFGVRPPITTQLAFALQERGFAVNQRLLTPEELAEEIYQKIIIQKDKKGKNQCGEKV
ncbi:MAG: energy-coupling factor transport system ATP-binding protein [Candidatus Atribacteria bacterium]|nr:energy-coupling factor transport system ATP-binding protein [Candidatus Atribacteria bacterium]